MTDRDYGAFETAFRRLSGAFRVTLPSEEQMQLTRTYFRVLQPYPLRAVLEAGKQLLATSTHMPKPAHWVAAVTPSRQPPDVRQMSLTEAHALAEAAAAGYSGAPCTCQACVEAGVSDRLLRFVPEEPEERAFNPLRQKVDLVGHWAHGEELRRWYAAREACVASLPPRLRRLVSREPGEEG